MSELSVQSMVCILRGMCKWRYNFFYYFLCVCVYMCECMYVCTHVCECAVYVCGVCAHVWLEEVVRCPSPSLCSIPSRQGLSLKLELGWCPAGGGYNLPVVFTHGAVSSAPETQPRTVPARNVR